MPLSWPLAESLSSSLDSKDNQFSYSVLETETKTHSFQWGVLLTQLNFPISDGKVPHFLEAIQRRQHSQVTLSEGLILTPLKSDEKFPLALKMQDPPLWARLCFVSLWWLTACDWTASPWLGGKDGLQSEVQSSRAGRAGCLCVHISHGFHKQPAETPVTSSQTACLQGSKYVWIS